MRLHPALLLLALLAFGCDFGSDPAKGPSFLGTWKDKTDWVYTRADTLYREGLRQYMAGHGVDIDKYFEEPDSQTVSLEEFNRLIDAYAWTCPEGVDCNEVLWTEVRKYVFTRDSLVQTAYRNGALRYESRSAYRFDKDSLYTTVIDTFEWARYYRFLDRDTLALDFYFGVYQDTLVRLE